MTQVTDILTTFKLGSRCEVSSTAQTGLPSISASHNLLIRNAGGDLPLVKTRRESDPLLSRRLEVRIDLFPVVVDPADTISTKHRKLPYLCKGEVYPNRYYFCLISLAFSSVFSRVEQISGVKWKSIFLNLPESALNVASRIASVEDWKGLSGDTSCYNIRGKSMEVCVSVIGLGISLQWRVRGSSNTAENITEDDHWESSGPLAKKAWYGRKKNLSSESKGHG